MFGESKETISPTASAVLLAKGVYKSDAETILSGYKTYQRKYVINQVIIKLIITAIAIFSSVFMIITNESGSPMPVLYLLICLSVGYYFVREPIGNKRKLKKSLNELQGVEYEAMIYSDKVVISTIGLSENENNSENNECSFIKDNESKDSENVDSENYTDGDNPDEIPSTVIHLDSHIVDFIDRKDMFILCVKKSYVFIIPKSAFSEKEISDVKDRLSTLLGIRYKNV